MAKRASKVDEPAGSSPSKRARTEDSDEELIDDDGELEIEMPHRKLVNGKAKGKARRRNDDDDDQESDNDNEDVVDEDQQAEMFENEHRGRILADLEEKRKVQGGVAEFGIIERIEMLNFMCHKYLTFEFGPQINFIIGHNGSGKSAVLSAITVALGGKTASTGRGSGLKSFIKEGLNSAEVTITLKNQGDEAYRPREYGKSIVITRRFSKEGSSSWKIKSAGGTVISSKREELSAICDHMNIQVDNPMNVLTQDAARQFLSASSPADKYKFFLRGTQLSQLSAEYDTCWTNVQQTFKVLAHKKEAIPDLKAVFNEATVRYQEAGKAREQKEKAVELKRELAWAHVRAKEEEMTVKVTEAAELEARLPKYQQKVDEALITFDAATADVTMYEAEVVALGDIEELTQQRTDIQNEIKENKILLQGYNNDLKKIDQNMNGTAKQIDELERRIAAETERMAKHTQAKHDEMQKKLQAARDELEKADGEYKDLLQQDAEQRKINEDIKRQGEGLEAERERLKGLIRSAEGMIERARQAQQNKLAPYGRNIRELLQQIKTVNWIGEVPLGPLGVYVKAKDPQKWGQLLGNQLAGNLMAFAVTNAKDRAQLKRMLDQSGNPRVQIVIVDKDLFDYSSGEPPQEYLTVLRALEFTNEYVLRILINQAKIESQILAPTRREAQDQLQRLRGGNAWTLDRFNVRVFREGGVSSTPLGMRQQNDATSLLLTGSDAGAEVGRYRDEIKQHEAAYKEALDREDGLKTIFTAGRRKLDALKAQLDSVANTARRAKHTLSTLQQEVNDDLPVNITSLQAAKEEAEEENRATEEQAKDILSQKKGMGDKQKVLLTRSNAIKHRIDEFNELKSAAANKVIEAVEKRTTAKRQKEYYEQKLADEEKKVKSAQTVAELLQEEFTNWTEKAQEFCDRVENPRKPEVVQRILETVQRAVAAREKEQGATVEELAVEVRKTEQQLKNAQYELKQMSILNKAIKNSLTIRLARWQEFRRFIALRCKFVFSYHLSQRGYYGKVLFNHDQQTLVLRVQTDDQVGTQSSREKDPRSLSGGEKSFSTICLLLSLWESIGCPIRCLDEFDVFMDAVNRRISMKMMIETANSSDKKQYILITPQDMGNVQLGPTVKVNRMIDPERSQIQN